jgi:NAD(P)-dependent dehydrogenase (short-subunit alcohol dehydrogenase family)
MTAAKNALTKTLIVTGGGSGIGAATAHLLSKTMRVVVADYDGDKAAEIATEIRANGGDSFAVQVDVANAPSVARMATTVAEHYGPVHALFCNAGRFSPTPVATLKAQEWRDTLAVHVKGTFLCCQAILTGMVSDRIPGTIVTMSSDYAVKGMQGGALYAASKTAIFSLTKSLALEFADNGIRVNAVGPGPIETPLLRRGMSDQDWNDFRQTRAKQVPMGRLGQPAEVASVVDFLLSDRSSYMTGQIIHPNGGQLSW